MVENVLDEADPDEEESTSTPPEVVEEVKDAINTMAEDVPRTDARKVMLLKRSKRRLVKRSRG